MPIRRVKMWAAICPVCVKPVDLGDGSIAYAGRDEVKFVIEESSDDGDSLDQRIADCCTNRGHECGSLYRTGYRRKTK